MFLSMFWVENGNDKQVRPEPIISLKIKKTKTVALIPFQLTNFLRVFSSANCN